MSFGERLKQEFFRKYPSTEIEFEGCTNQEIDFLMDNQKVDSLPQTYQELLKVMGRRGLGVILDGCATYKYLEDLKEAFTNELEHVGLKFPQDIFVFFHHQGYMFYFFRTDSNDSDPCVYGWRDDLKSFSKLANKISEFFFEHVHAKILGYGHDGLVDGFLYDSEKDDFYLP